MGFPFQSSIQQLIGMVAVPLHDFVFEPRISSAHRHGLLWDCYRSGQMSDADLGREITSDPDFGNFVATLHARH